MTKWDSSQDHKDGSNMHKSINVIHHINYRKVKNHMIILIDAEKSFDKEQHPFMIKTLTKAGIEGICLNIIKAIYDKLTASINTQWRKAQSLPTKIWNKIRMRLSPLSLAILLEVLPTTLRQTK